MLPLVHICDSLQLGHKLTKPPTPTNWEMIQLLVP